MIPTINLLPYHTDRKSKRRQNALAWLGAGALTAAALTFLGGGYVDHLNEQQQQINSTLTAENAKLDIQLKEVATLKKDIDDLLERQLAVEGVQSERNRPVQLLEELVKIVPEGVYLTEIKQVDGNFTLRGIAQSNERVSEFLRNVSQVPWLDKAELLETKFITINTSSKEQKKLYDFGMKFAYREEVKPDPKKAKNIANASAVAVAVVASGSK